VLPWIALLVLASPAQLAARRAAAQTRDIRDDAFLLSRPVGKKKAPGRGRLKVIPVGRQPAAGAAADQAEIGITVWRYRRAVLSDPPDVREIMQEGDESASEWTPVRVGSGLALEIGQRFRLAIESPRRGYLYVVDRSRYADGPPGASRLIFPTTQIRGGDNEVFAGRLVDLPSHSDAKPYFVLRARREGLVAEEVLVVITKDPLPFEPGAEPLVVSDEQIARWEREWGAAAWCGEVVGWQEAAYTQAERRAGEAAAAVLSQDDPPPALIFRVPSRPNTPLFLRLVIRVAPSREAPEPRAGLEPSAAELALE
jgi:hypothetical protein